MYINMHACMHVCIYICNINISYIYIYSIEKATPVIFSATSSAPPRAPPSMAARPGLRNARGT